MRTPSPKKADRRWIVAFWIYFGLLLFISLAAYLRWIPARVADYDKFGHLFLIGTAGILSHQALGERMIQLGKISLPLGPILVTVFSFIDETLQIFSPARSYSLIDLMANWIGIWMFYWLLVIIRRLLAQVRE
ncbi:MAG: VanZ family protein [Roseofilum sp. SBFL]|uniref:VanZ family protein n=1 Tax=unclassified Roseofilum TaxID=2620099 RepID=UPI001B04292E|nr:MULTISPECIES: VanZ family protein [unclassified Roseofilum]MBP0013369.1 VanZ family protein [Roseofilum sp. SID3]MBP0024170.1 VanZ family protein [Roseofilum sp. SID2]MBP0036413.1 VanZ family protein [Roseofilum sp. SID1]MBP0044054.1 VanZ family protein [Roseofilum sp. SBFL]